MSDYLNLAISIAALALSIASALFSWSQHKKAARLQARDELIEALAIFSRFEIALSQMKRERDKTGAPIGEDEKSLFETLESASDNFYPVSNTIHELLNKSKIPTDERLLTEIRIFKQHADSLIGKIEMLFERFKRFNDSRISDVKQRLDALQNSLG